MISILHRAMSPAVVVLVCVAGAIGAGVVVWQCDGFTVVLPVAVIAGLTGALAALAMVIFPPSPSEAPVGQPSLAMASAAGPQPQSHHLAAPSPTDRALQAAPVPPSGVPTEQSPDPQAAALLAAHQALLVEHRALVPEYRTLLVQRAALLRGLAELVARLPDESAWQVAKLLEEAGARKIMPEPGDRFDPLRQNVLGTEPTPDASVHDTVAATLRVGWRDRDRVLAPANVVLYALVENAEGGPDDGRQ